MKQIEQKSRKRSLREKSVRWLACFFLVMLLLTLLSRAADAVTVPVIQTDYLKKSTIDRTITAEGRIVQNQERAVSTVAGLRDTIQQDSENPNSYVVTIQVPAGTLEIGTVAVMIAVLQSETYTACVPLSAIHREDGQDYVLAVQETKTVLGTELAAERIPVTILLAALSPSALTEDQKLITGSNKEVNGGDRVRLEDT